MIQRAIGVFLGAAVTFILLFILAGGEDAQQYVVAVVVGALVTFFWPIAITWWLGRSARQRQQDRIEAEVQRQLDQQRRPEP